MNYQDLSQKEKAWLVLYQQKSSFEVIGLEDVSSFAELKELNIKWFEHWATEVLAGIK